MVKNIRILLQLLILTFFFNSCGTPKVQTKDKDLLNKQLAIFLEPYVEIINDTTIVFGAIATRKYNMGNEILPSSEDFRVEVMDTNRRTLLWSSYHNREFLAGVQKVQPQKIGEKKEYKMIWNRRNSKGLLIPNDLVWVRIMIPAMPENFIESYLVKLTK